MSGLGIGKGGVKHSPTRSIVSNNIDGIKKASIRRLARRGGVLRLGGLVHLETKRTLEKFLSEVIGYAILYTTNAGCKTISVQHMDLALRRKGKVVFM